MTAPQVIPDEWHIYAACAQSRNPEAFWPNPHTWKAPAEAQATCSRCPVRWRCLQFALEHDEPGVWGGLTELERHRLPAQTKRTIRGLAQQPIVLA